ncbi:MAG: TIGR04086 family membrane protein [Candidatus Howiella sp.]
MFKTNTSSADQNDFYRPVLYGLICGVIATVFMLFVLAFVMTLKDVPAAAVSAFSSLAVGFGGLCGGFFASRKAGRKGLFFGAATGIFLYIIVLCASLIVNSGAFSVMSIIKLAITVLSAAIGGILGVNMKKRRKY